MDWRIVTEEKIESFREYLIREEKSSATLEKYVRDVRAFSRYASGRSVAKETVIAYKKKLISDGYAPRSINSMLALLNSFFRYAGWMDYRVKSIKIQRQIYCSKEKELTKREYIRLVQTAERQGRERLALLLQTVCSTGIRISELKFITVEAVKKGEAQKVSCKGKVRIVFLVNALRKKLLCYAKRKNICSGQIFITRSGKIMGRVRVWREMKKLCGQAGVNPEKVFPHNLRHLSTRIYIMTSGKEHCRRMEYMGLVC